MPEITGIEAGSLVILHCQNPKEKLWGALVRLDTVGTVIRGLDLNSVEDWMRQERDGSDRLIMPTTQFYPMHRIERMYLDESSAAFEGFGDRFRATCGHDASDALHRVHA